MDDETNRCNCCDRCDCGCHETGAGALAREIQDMGGMVVASMTVARVIGPNGEDEVVLERPEEITPLEALGMLEMAKGFWRTLVIEDDEL